MTADEEIAAGRLMIACGEARKAGRRFDIEFLAKGAIDWDTCLAEPMWSWVDTRYRAKLMPVTVTFQVYRFSEGRIAIEQSSEISRVWEACHIKTIEVEIPAKGAA